LILTSVVAETLSPYLFNPPSSLYSWIWILETHKRIILYFLFEVMCLEKMNGVQDSDMVHLSYNMSSELFKTNNQHYKRKVLHLVSPQANEISISGDEPRN
jgi:hypothetical protein